MVQATLAGPKSAPSAQSKLQLSAPKRRLVELMTRVNFGKIETLHVRSGEPIFSPHPRVTRTLKVGGAGTDADRNDPHQRASGDFTLKTAVIELLAHIEILGNGTIERIQVANGLPLLLELCDPAPAA